MTHMTHMTLWSPTDVVVMACFFWNHLLVHPLRDGCVGVRCLQCRRVGCWCSCGMLDKQAKRIPNRKKHIIPFFDHCFFCLPFAWLWIEFCFFWLFDAQARADEIEALKKAKLTLASDWTHSSRFLNEPKLQTFEQLGRPQITWSLLTLVERPLWGVPTTWVRAALRVPRKVCDRRGSLLWHRLLMSLPGCFSCFGPLV